MHIEQEVHYFQEYDIRVFTKQTLRSVNLYY
jgi:hypothetical protein